MAEKEEKKSTYEQRILVVELCNELKIENAYSIENMKRLTSKEISEYIDNLIADRRIRQNGYAKSEHNPAMIGMAIKLVWAEHLKCRQIGNTDKMLFIVDVKNTYELFRKARDACEKLKVSE